MYRIMWIWFKCRPLSHPVALSGDPPADTLAAVSPSNISAVQFHMHCPAEPSERVVVALLYKRS